jgi:hypothetical protein
VSFQNRRWWTKARKSVAQVFRNEYKIDVDRVEHDVTKKERSIYIHVTTELHIMEGLQWYAYKVNIQRILCKNVG